MSKRKTVPLPTPANPGDRVRIRLLSGVGAVDPTALVNAHLVPENAQITIVGNADRFDYATTKIVYYDDAHRADAAARRTAGKSEVPRRIHSNAAITGCVFLSRRAAKY